MKVQAKNCLLKIGDKDLIAPTPDLVEFPVGDPAHSGVFTLNIELPKEVLKSIESGDEVKIETKTASLVINKKEGN